VAAVILSTLCPCASALDAMLDSDTVLLLRWQMGERPNLSPRKQAARTAREERLAQALRDNLRRRREQARAQAERVARSSDVCDDLSSAPHSSKTSRHGGTTAD